MALFGPHRSPPRRRLVVTAFVACVLVLLSSCGGSGFAYVSSSDHRAYFKVPYGWKFYDKRDILVASGQSLSEAAADQFSWLIAYDADPHPSLDHVLAIEKGPSYPVIMARVQKLSPVTRDQMSLAGLRNVVYPIDRLAQVDAASILSEKDLALAGGYHGSRLDYEVTTQGVSAVNTGNVVIRVDQIALLNNNSDTLYLFTIRCESHCFRDNQSLIQQIADSWTVKEH